MKKPYVFLIMLISFYGCTKNLENNFSTAHQIDSPAISEKDKLLVENLQKVTAVFQELYKARENVMLVNASIFSYSYTDESVLFRDLIYPDRSRLTTSNRFQMLCEKWNVSHGKFAALFWAEVNKRNDSAFAFFLASQRPQLSAARNTGNDEPAQVSIYFPYSKNFENSINDDTDKDDRDQVPSPGGPETFGVTLVAASGEADQGEGSRPVYQSGQIIRYDNVLADDPYVEVNETHIIGVNGIEPNELSNSTTEAFPPDDPINVPNLPREMKQVYVGDVRCTYQYDNLISISGNGGGSEIRFARSDGYLKVGASNGQVTAENFIIGDKSISRASIRKASWVTYALAWDEDWEADNHQQYYAIFEDDNENSSELSASISTTFKLFDGITTTVGPVAVKLAYKSKDEIIRHDIFKRDVFFAYNRFNQEGQIHNGWPVRDRFARVSYTLYDRTLY